MITKRCNTVPRYFKIIFCNMEYSILLMTVTMCMYVSNIKENHLFTLNSINVIFLNIT